MSAPQQQLLQLARRLSTVGITSLTGWTAYKSNTDPIHIFWDLDHTILCSVSPLPSNNKKDHSDNGPVESSLLMLQPPNLHYFDQIDDDFPYNTQTLTPNTRTYFRPGAKLALWVCSKLGICHVYTAAQESYTYNILTELDPKREVFKGFVLHRTEYPRIVREGKDLTVVMGSNCRNTVCASSEKRHHDDDDDETTYDKNETTNEIRLERAILFDDKVSNFKPQRYQNGVGVIPFTEQRLNKLITNNNGSGSSVNNDSVVNNWAAYLDEVKEMARLVGISVWGTVHLSGDVRKVVGWVRKMNGSGDA